MTLQFYETAKNKTIIELVDTTSSNEEQSETELEEIEISKFFVNTHFEKFLDSNVIVKYNSRISFKIPLVNQKVSIPPPKD